MAGHEEDRRREIQQLRGDIAVLRVQLHVALNRGAKRPIILAYAALLREKTERLEELDRPAWID
jgi:hypothetical protein